MESSNNENVETAVTPADDEPEVTNEESVVAPTEVTENTPVACTDNPKDIEEANVTEESVEEESKIEDELKAAQATIQKLEGIIGSLKSGILHLDHKKGSRFLRQDLAAMEQLLFDQAPSLEQIKESPTSEEADYVDNVFSVLEEDLDEDLDEEVVESKETVEEEAATEPVVRSVQDELVMAKDTIGKLEGIVGSLKSAILHIDYERGSQFLNQVIEAMEVLLFEGEEALARKNEATMKPESPSSLSTLSSPDSLSSSYLEEDVPPAMVRCDSDSMASSSNTELQAMSRLGTTTGTANSKLAELSDLPALEGWKQFSAQKLPDKSIPQSHMLEQAMAKKKKTFFGFF